MDIHERLTDDFEGGEDWSLLLSDRRAGLDVDGRTGVPVALPRASRLEVRPQPTARAPRQGHPRAGPTSTKRCTASTCVEVFAHMDERFSRFRRSRRESPTPSRQPVRPGASVRHRRSSTPRESAPLRPTGVLAATRAPPRMATCIEADDGTVLAANGEAIGVATNNVAEYRALLAGLEHAAELGVPDIVVVSDSELLVKQMRGEYRVKNAALRELHAEASRVAQSFDAVTYTAVRREHNELADRLVERSARRQPGYNRTARADVAQLVERLLAMQKVEGSSPFIRSIESPPRRPSRKREPRRRSCATRLRGRRSSPRDPSDPRRARS